MQKVYVSSTSRDLPEYRAVARDSILQMGLFPVLYEDFGSAGQPVIDVLREKINESDVFVGIYAHRYGYIPEGSEKSITHLEYEWAREHGIPCLLFIVDDVAPFPPEYVDVNNKEKLRAFKAELLKDFVVSFFVSPEDFRAKLILALANVKPRFQTAINIGEGTIVDGSINVINVDEATIEQIVNRTLDIYDARRRVESEKQVASEANPDLICSEPVFGRPRKEQQYYCQVFAIMPFDKELEPVYQLVMKPVCQRQSLNIKRGDDFHATYHIMDEIWTAIYRSELVIVDCTNNKPNVFYELGIAHTLGKPAILITQQPDKMPFDIRSRRFIPYQDTGAGFDKLSKELEDAIIKIMNKQP